MEELISFCVDIDTNKIDTPMKELLFGMLKESILGAIGLGEKCGAEEEAELIAWVGSDDESYPFSFVNLCQAFDLPVTKVRKRIFLARDGVVTIEFKKEMTYRGKTNE